jgi:hypothetical protein
MGGETEKSGSTRTVDSLKELTDSQIASLRTEMRDQKELLQAENASTALNLVVAREALEKRLEGLNELRQDVVKDRAQFVKTDVYVPAHEELRRQRVTDAEKITVIQGDVKSNATDIAGMKNSLSWLTRLIVGGLVLALIAYAFERLRGG